MYGVALHGIHAAMGTTVSVAGASGYAGGELLRLLLGHPGLELGALAAGASAGQPVTALHPSLLPLADRLFVPTDPATLAEADLVFLALPHGESAAARRAASRPTCRSSTSAPTSGWLTPADWASYYGGAARGHVDLRAARAARRRAARSRRAAGSPTPAATRRRSSSALAPLLAAGLVEPADVVVVGGVAAPAAPGARPATALLASEVMGDRHARTRRAEPTSTPPRWSRR